MKRIIHIIAIKSLSPLPVQRAADRNKSKYRFSAGATAQSSRHAEAGDLAHQHSWFFRNPQPPSSDQRGATSGPWDYRTVAVEHHAGQGRPWSLVQTDRFLLTCADTCDIADEPRA